MNLPLPEWWYDDKDNVEDFDVRKSLPFMLEKANILIFERSSHGIVFSPAVRATY